MEDIVDLASSGMGCAASPLRVRVSGSTRFGERPARE